MLIRPFLAEVAELPAFYGEVTTIAPCWSQNGSCWLTLRPQLAPRLDAFVWWQGEYDAILDPPTPIEVYAQRQTDLITRIRSANGNPRLLVVVLQMGPMFDGPRGGTIGPAYQQFKREWAAADVNAVYVPTADLAWRTDEVHMTDQGYRDVSARIREQVAARTR